MREKIFTALFCMVFVVVFVVSGIIEGKVNDDWIKANKTKVEVQTIYIIDGNEYIVAVSEKYGDIVFDEDGCPHIK